MIEIKNLTQEQCTLLDTMWSLDTEEEFCDWVETLNLREQKEVDVLQRLLIMEILDEQMQSCDLSEAKELLGRFQ